MTFTADPDQRDFERQIFNVSELDGVFRPEHWTVNELRICKVDSVDKPVSEKLIYFQKVRHDRNFKAVSKSNYFLWLTFDAMSINLLFGIAFFNFTQRTIGQ